MADFELDNMLLEAAGWPKEGGERSHTSSSKRRRASSMSSDDRSDSSPDNDDEDDDNEFDERGGGRGGEVGKGSKMPLKKRLNDYQSKKVVMNWRAQDAFVTKLDVLDGNYLVLSSADKTLRLKDLQRSFPTQMQTFKGHLDGVVSFALRSTNMLSAAGNKIGLSSLSKSPHSGVETHNYSTTEALHSTSTESVLF